MTTTPAETWDEMVALLNTPDRYLATMREIIDPEHTGGTAWDAHIHIIDNIWAEKPCWAPQPHTITNIVRRVLPVCVCLKYTQYYLRICCLVLLVALRHKEIPGRTVNALEDIVAAHPETAYMADPGVCAPAERAHLVWFYNWMRVVQVCGGKQAKRRRFAITLCVMLAEHRICSFGGNVGRRMNRRIHLFNILSGERVAVVIG